jgi:hypothetical protein
LSVTPIALLASRPPDEIDDEDDEQDDDEDSGNGHGPVMPTSARDQTPRASVPLERQ